MFIIGGKIDGNCRQLKDSGTNHTDILTEKITPIFGRCLFYSDAKVTFHTKILRFSYIIELPCNCCFCRDF